jgi:hypothetical protein
MGWVGLAVAFAAVAQAAEPPCPGGRFAVAGEALLQNLGGTADAIEIAGGRSPSTPAAE